MEMKFEPTKPWHLTSAELTELLDRTYKAHKDAEPRRRYLGASLIGHPCERHLGYQYHQAPADDGKGFTGRTYRIFDMGHDGEDRMAEYLRIAGFDLRTAREDGSQFGFSAAGGKIAGHIDGVILGGPSLSGLRFPCGWENKALGDKKFGEFVKYGIAFSSTYEGQVQIYEAYLELQQFLFTAINRDTGEVAAHVVEFDPSAAQALSDKAVRVVQSASPEELPRVARERTDFRCKFCDFADRCWSAPQHQAAATGTPSIRPPWL